MKSVITTIKFFVASFLIVGMQPVHASELLLFSDDTFLGCLSCSKYDSNSICNPYGSYGSKYSGSSIWNPYGSFGNPYSANSPWNRYSTSSPSIVDRSGNFYGRFSINIYSGFSNSSNLLECYNAVDGDLERVQEGFCQ